MLKEELKIELKKIERTALSQLNGPYTAESDAITALRLLRELVILLAKD